MKRAYLDNAASTPIRKEVLKVMIKTLKYSLGNPSSIQHSYGREARSIIEESRICIANKIKASPSEIIFTSGGTEANNLVLRSSILDLEIKYIITSQLEHPSVLQTILDLSNKYKISVDFISNDKKGILDLNNMEKMLKQNKHQKTLVSLMYANNEIGNLLEVDKVIFLCKKYNAYFHSDTIQIIGNFPIDMQKLSFDFATASGHKFYGPKGVGFAFIRKDILKYMKPFMIGGVQEFGIRSGTENVHGIAGLSEAIRLAYSNSNFSSYMNKMQDLKSYCILKLKKIVPNIIFNGLSSSFERSIPSILNFLYPTKKDHLLYFHLDLMGVAVSQGSSCTSQKKISHVIQSITDKYLLNKTMPIRISFGIFNEKKDVDLLVEALQKIRK
jgi:Cysteine sulfinate desulfinase/cysteine desulfurase and related enzymes